MRQSSVAPQSDIDATTGRHYGWLTDIAWVMAAALLILLVADAPQSRERLLMALSGRVGFYAVPAMIQAILQWLSFIPAILVLVRAVADPGYGLRRSTTLHLMVGLGALAGASVFWSVDRLSGVLIAGQWIACSLLAWTLYQTTRSGRMLAAGLALLVGMLAMLACGVATETLYFYPAQLDDWMVNRESMLKAMGIATASATADALDRQVVTLSTCMPAMSPNTIASIWGIGVLLTFAVVLRGVVGRSARQCVWGGLALLVTGGLLAETRCRTVMALVGAACLVLALIEWRKLRLPVKLLQWALLLVTLAIPVLILVVGTLWPELLPASLHARWVYWKASLNMLAGHWFGGLGAGSFVQLSPEYRLPLNFEYPRATHNLLFEMLTNAGALGVALCLAFCFWIYRDIARGLGGAGRQEQEEAGGAARSLLLVSGVAGLAAAGGGAVRLAALDHPGSSLLVFGIRLLGFALFAWITAVACKRVQWRMGWLVPAIAASVAMVMVSGMLDMQFRDGTVLGVLAVAVAVLLAAIDEGAMLPATQVRPVLVGMCVAALAVAVGPLRALVAGEYAASQAAQALVRNDPQSAIRQLDEAYAASAMLHTSDYLFAKTKLMVDLKLPPAAVLEAGVATLDAGPRDYRVGTLLADYLAGQNGDPALVRKLYEASLSLDPWRLETHVALATYLDQHGATEDALVHWRRVAELYEMAGLDPNRDEKVELYSQAQKRLKQGSGPVVPPVDRGN